MATKKKRRNSSRTLTEEREGHFLGGMYELLSGVPKREDLFDSDLQRRAVYLANENYLIDLYIEDRGPGRRPEAFWDYCAKLPEGANSLKYLIENNLLLDGELAEVKAEFYSKLQRFPEGWKADLEWIAAGLGGKEAEAWAKYQEGVNDDA